MRASCAVLRGPQLRFIRACTGAALPSFMNMRQYLTAQFLQWTMHVVR